MISSSLFKRIISSVVLIGLSLAALIAGSPWINLLVIGVAAALSYEWMGLWRFERQKIAFAFYGLIIALTGASLFLALPIILVLCLFSAPIFYYLLSRLNKGKDQRQALSFFWGILYIALPPLVFLWILGEESGLFLILWMLLVIWASDIGAYFIGSWLKGPKLAPQISPKKTWSGFIGGCILSALVGGGIAQLFSLGSFLSFIGVGLVVAILGSIGDLIESALKRHAGVKDSSNLIPGHGGFLDRLDSTLFVLPFYGVYVWLMV